MSELTVTHEDVAALRRIARWGRLSDNDKDTLLRFAEILNDLAEDEVLAEDEEEETHDDSVADVPED